jgi:tRNA(Ile2)-agmatinylcytidine synthase
VTVYNISVDSTDSAEKGMCTTYLGAVLLERLENLPLDLITYPELIRLNPNVPWKTRGNGAFCIRYEGEQGLGKDILSITTELIEELSVFEDPQTNPGLAYLEGAAPAILKKFYYDALRKILTIDQAERAAHKSRAIIKGWKNRRGVIGSLASLGADLREFTYEAIMYRSRDIKFRERMVEKREISIVSKRYPSTFFNVDENGDPVCIPSSPCPVIIGMRGTDPKEARDALLEIKMQNAERWVLWKTNQHTDAHITEACRMDDIKPYSSISMVAEVSTKPDYGEGGHLNFTIKGPDDTIMTAGAYEPTKEFRKALSNLVPGDMIRVWGSVREGRGEFGPGLNLEKVEVLSLEEVSVQRNPRCPICGGPTESMGKGQGLSCKSCGLRNGIQRKMVKIERDIEKGFIELPMTAWRHLGFL